MPSWTFDDYFGDVQSAINTGVFAQGYGATYGPSFADRFGAAFPRSQPSSNRFSDANYGDAFTVTPGGGLGGSTKVTPKSQPSITDPTTWKIPGIGDVIEGMKGGPEGGDKTVDVGLQSGLQGYLSGIGSSIEAWIPRIILVVLGLIFVAVGLSMFGVNTPVGQGVIREVRNRIPAN